MDTNTITPEQIKEQLVQELNISHLSNEEQAEVITKMSTIILDRLSITLLSKLPKDVLEHVNTLLESGQSEVVQAIIAKHIDNIDVITTEVIAETMAEYTAMNENSAAEINNN